nr:inositol oxygenase-like [Symphalangus syndactylus]
MHMHHTVDFVRSKHAWFGDFSYKKMKVMEAVDLLHGLVDESDSGVDSPTPSKPSRWRRTSEKLTQARTGSSLLGFYDLGKVLALLGEPQWAIVGDTFPVGCCPQTSVVL